MILPTEAQALQTPKIRPRLEDIDTLCQSITNRFDLPLFSKPISHDGNNTWPSSGLC